MATASALFEEVETFQNLLMASATGGHVTDPACRAARE
jgi:hypothetical protein